MHTTEHPNRNESLFTASKHTHAHGSVSTSQKLVISEREAGGGREEMVFQEE